MNEEKQIADWKNDEEVNLALAIHNLAPIGLEIAGAVARDLIEQGYSKQSKPISCGHEKGEWISVEERLPRISDNVLCYIKEYDSIGIYAYTGTDEWDNDRYCGSAKYIGITHWMPLPPQPKENGHNWATVVPKAPNACDELASISKKIDEIFNDENVSEETKAIMSAEFIGMFTGNIGKIGDKIGKMEG